MNRFVFKNTFIKVYIHPLFDKYFYNNKRSKLYFGDRVVVVNVGFFRTEGVYLEGFGYCNQTLRSLVGHFF
jgi:hypothetical protein